MSKHTPGPWKVRNNADGYLTAIEAGNWTVCQFFQARRTLVDDQNRDEANARRIVECVNACEGIENPTDVMRELASLRKHAERDPKNTEQILVDVGRVLAALGVK